MRKVWLAALLLPLLAGCVPTHTYPTPVPTPSGTPLFASDEEALKAATDAYAKYLEISDQILQEGGTDPERAEAVATRDALASIVTGAGRYLREGNHIVGDATFAPPELEHYDSGAVSDLDIIAIYVCVDVSLVGAFDSSGNSLVLPTRPDRQPFEASFDRVGSKLKVSLNSPWTGAGVCK